MQGINFVNILVYFCFVIAISAVLIQISKFEYLIKNSGNHRIRQIAYKRNLLIFIFVLGFSFLLSSRRIDVGGLGGADAYHYYTFFIEAKGGLWEYLASLQFEPVVLLYFYFMRQITSNYFIVQFVYFAFLAFLMTLVVRKTGWNPKAKASYIIFAMHMLITMCLMRNNLSVVMGWLSIIYLINGKTFKSVVWALFAFLTHYSAVIIFAVIVVYHFFMHARYNIKKIFLYIILLLPLCFLVAYIGGNILLKGRYEIYEAGPISLVGNVFRCIFLVLAIRFSYNSPGNKRLKKILIVYSCSLFLIPLQLAYSIMYRMIPFFDICLVLAMIQIRPVKFTLRKNNAELICLLNDGYLIYLLISFLLISCVSYGLYPFVL